MFFINCCPFANSSFGLLLYTRAGMVHPPCLQFYYFILKLLVYSLTFTINTYQNLVLIKNNESASENDVKEKYRGFFENIVTPPMSKNC